MSFRSVCCNIPSVHLLRSSSIFPDFPLLIFPTHINSPPVPSWIDNYTPPQCQTNDPVESFERWTILIPIPSQVSPWNPWAIISVLPLKPNHVLIKQAHLRGISPFRT